MANLEGITYKKAFSLIKNGDDLKDISERFELSELETTGLIEILQSEGYNIDLITVGDKTLIQKKNTYKTNKKVKPERNELIHTKLCIVSDTHLCSTLQQPTLLKKIYKEAEARGIDKIFHCGDIVDGDYTKIRPDHQYQIFARGFDEQLNYVRNIYPKIDGITTYMIEGSHDQTHVKNGGATLGYWLGQVRDDMVYLGTPECVIKINNIKIKMQHPGGGSARSLSYKPQIAIDEMDSGEKPNIFIQGHYHKEYYAFYRNVHAFLVPSLMNQSGFMKMNNISNIMGALFLDIYADEKGHVEYLQLDPYEINKKDIKKQDIPKVKQLEIKNNITI